MEKKGKKKSVKSTTGDTRGNESGARGTGMTTRHENWDKTDTETYKRFKNAEVVHGD